MTKILRNLSTPELRAYWEQTEKNVEKIKDWPDWKRAGINVTQLRAEPRIVLSNSSTNK